MNVREFVVQKLAYAAINKVAGAALVAIGLTLTLTGSAAAQTWDCGMAADGNLVTETNPATDAVKCTLEGGTLTVSGTGAMANYWSNLIIPWYDQRSSITSLVIEEGVTTIGGQAFHGCTNLTLMVIPNSVKTIGYLAFYGCTNLSLMVIPNSVKTIGYLAFYGCTNLSSITIPDGVTSIGNYAFQGCIGLTSIEIPDGVTSIGYYAFQGCIGLTSIEIPDGVTSIEGLAFSGCSGLTSITIPDGVTSIGEWAFYGCSGLTSITIPSSVTSIGHEVFSGCTGLRSIWILNPVPFTDWTGAFNDLPYKHETSLYVPQDWIDGNIGWDYIGWDEFENVYSLASLVSLTVSSGTLHPEFHPENTRYSVTVSNNVSDLTITPVPIYGDAVVVGGGDVSLVEGINTFEIEVEAFGSHETYTLVVERLSTHTVTYTVPTPNGVLTVTNGTTAIESGAFVDYGTVLTITAKPDDGYELATLTVNGVAFKSGGTHKVTGAVTITAAFTLIPVMYVVTVAGATSGTGGGSYEAGDTVWIASGTPPKGERFVKWSAEGAAIVDSTRGKTSFIMPAVAVTVTAVFEPNTVSIAAGPNVLAKSAVNTGIFYEGGSFKTADLSVYDVMGNVITKIKVSDPRGTEASRKVGVWDLKGKNGQRVNPGTYLIKGTITTIEGGRERVSEKVLVK